MTSIVPQFAEALCVQIGGDLWFPENGEDPSQAKAICNRCTHKTDCLIFALETHQPYGIFGGLSPNERRTLHRRGKRGRPRGVIEHAPRSR